MVNEIKIGDKVYDAKFNEYFVVEKIDLYVIKHEPERFLKIFETGENK